MKQINSTAIIGAGALGLMYMESISPNNTIESYFLVDRDRYITQKGKQYSINSKPLQFAVKSADELTVSPDLIIVAVKTHNLDSIKTLLEKSAGPETIIISVLNGISSETLLQSILPHSVILYSAVLGMDAVKEGNSLSYSRKGKFLLGTKENRMTEELKRIKDFLESCHLEYIIPDDIHREIWYKWMINIGVNQLSAISGAPYGLFQTDRALQELMEQAMKETIEVARAEKVNLTVEDIKRWYEVLMTLGPGGKTSMLQDMDAMRKTEVESFAGELIRRAAKHGIPVPVNQTFFTVIKTKEQLYTE